MAYQPLKMAAYLTSTDGGNAGDCQEQSPPYAAEPLSFSEIP
jgi:hypothetical protein